MKHKNAHNWQEMADRLLFFFFFFYKLVISKRSECNVFPTDWEETTASVWCTSYSSQADIWSFFQSAGFTFKKQIITNSETAMNRNGDVIEMKHSEEKRRKDLEATQKKKKKWTVLRTVGAKGPHGENSSRKCFKKL